MLHPQSHISANDISKDVVDTAWHVHQQLGPGLLESAYEECLCLSLTKRNIPFLRQIAMPVFFEEQKIDIGYRIDLLVDNKIIIELKSVEKFIPLHEAQILTYMKLSGIKTGLLINFNTKYFKEGIKRLVL